MRFALAIATALVISSDFVAFCSQIPDLCFGFGSTVFGVLPQPMDSLPLSHWNRGKRLQEPRKTEVEPVER